MQNRQRCSGMQRNGSGALLLPEDGRVVGDGSGIMPRQLSKGPFPVLHPKILNVPTLPPQLKKMKEKKGLYPDKSIYTQQIGPGLCFGALALMLRFFFEVSGLWGGD